MLQQISCHSVNIDMRSVERGWGDEASKGMV